MQNFGFELPEAFLLYLLFLACRFLCKERLAGRYFPNLHFFGPPSRFPSLEKLLVHLTALLFVTALASPVFIDRSAPENRLGIDIALSIDASGSMEETGFDPDDPEKSKFQAVREVVADFIRNRPDDNIALAFFGDFGYITAPLTYEKEVLVHLLSLAEPGTAGKNTAIGEGIERGVRALERSKAKSRVLVLLTDGRHNRGRISPEQGVELAKKAGITLYTVGIGGEKDVDHDLLKLIAEEAGGRYFYAGERSGLEEAYAAIDDLERSPIRTRDYRAKTPLFPYPLEGAAMGLLGVMMLWRRRRR